MRQQRIRSALTALPAALFVAAGSPTILAKQESFALELDRLNSTDARIATTEGKSNDSVTLVQDDSLSNAGVLRWNLTLAAHEPETDTGESAYVGTDPPCGTC